MTSDRQYRIDIEASLQDYYIPGEWEREVIGDILRIYEALGEDKPDGSWDGIYREIHQPFLETLKDKNVDSLLPLFGNFLRSSLSRGLVSHSTFDDAVSKPDTWKTIARQHLKDVGIWMVLTDGADSLIDLCSSRVGNPYGILIDEYFIGMDAPRHSWHARTIQHWIDVIGPIHPRIVEIGGGYGGVYFFLGRLRNKKPMCYIDIDLHLPLLLFYYCASYWAYGLWGRKIRVIVAPDGNLPDDVDGADLVLVSAGARNKVALPVDIIYNANSLSEMGEATISDYMNLVDRCSPAALFQQNSNLGSVVESAEVWGHREIPASRFPYPKRYAEVYRAVAPWYSETVCYVEILHLRKDLLGQ